MSKLHKKCFLASAGMHVLLFLVILVGPAFLISRDKAKDMPTLDFIPAKLIDEQLSRQSTPTRKPTPAPPRQQERKVERPKPKPVAKRDPEPPKPRPEPKPETGGWKPTAVVLAQPKRIRIDPPKNQPPPEPNRAAITAAETIRKAAATPSIKITTPPGGGQAYADYAQAIKSIYERNWHPPDETSKDDAVVTVTIVIAKDGTVRSSRIIGRSGDGSVDASVDATLRRVTKVPAFPAGAKESTRTYTIGFNLKARRAIG